MWPHSWHCFSSRFKLLFLQCCLRSLPFETYSARGTVSRKSWALLWLLLEHARVFYEAGSDVLTHKTGSCHWTPIVPRCYYFFPLSVTTRKFASAPLFRFLCAAQVLLTVTLDLSLSELITARNAASCWQLGALKVSPVCVYGLPLRVH